jgi:RND family efflux transporter MFP subunit
MKRSVYILIATVLLAACGTKTKQEEIAELKKQRAEIDSKIKDLEKQGGDSAKVKATPVSVMEIHPEKFNAFVNVQAQITGDENVNATSQAPGTVISVNVRPGQRVGRGQTLASLDAAAINQQVRALDPQIALAKSLYEKQQKLWAQNIGTEVQLLQARTQYESLIKQRAAIVAQRNMYRIVSPISGTVDQVNVKVGDVVSPGVPGVGIRVVSNDKLKAQASLGENYLGKVKQGDPVTIVLPDINDSIAGKLTYVSQAVDPISRSFNVEVRLGNNKKLHPNMSAAMKIANYESSEAIVVPVSVIQKTAEGDMLYVVEGNKAKAVYVQTGRTADGNVEILGGLKAGDRVITEGYEDLDNGEAVAVK